MTKEQLYDELANVETEYGLAPIDVHDILEKFFSQNVVIPKGDNRHPYADVLHEWLEGAEVEFTHDEGADAWKLFSTNSIEKFRIKPEPVYEWQWEFTYNGLICRTGFYTYEQIKAYMYNIKVTKIEETKRERK